MVHEHIIRFNNVVRIPNTRKANRAIFAIKNYTTKHTHAKADKIHLSNDVNEMVWERGKNHKINRLKVVFRKKEDVVYVFTPEGNDLKNFDKVGKEPTPKTKAPAVKKETTTKEVVEKVKTEKKTETKTPVKTGETKTPAAKTTHTAEKKEKVA